MSVDIQPRHGLARRAAVAGAIASISAWSAGMGAARTGDPAMAEGTTRPLVEVPPFACDTHVHVIGDPRRFPMSPARDYTPASATAADLAEFLRFLDFSRVVVLTPVAYGADNAATIAAVAELGRDRARGVAWVSGKEPPGALDLMQKAGIVGMRAFLYEGGRFDAATAARRLQSRYDLAGERSWHLDISAPPDIVAALAPSLRSSPVPLVLDTFGWAESGPAQAGFGAVLALVETGVAYVKLSEPYRLSQQAPFYQDLRPVVQALVSANPDRILWGSGWPYLAGPVASQPRTAVVPNLRIDAGRLLDGFAEWVPDAALRRGILVSNPARLYGFKADVALGR